MDMLGMRSAVPSDLDTINDGEVLRRMLRESNAINAAAQAQALHLRTWVEMLKLQVAIPKQDAVWSLFGEARCADRAA